MNLSLRGTAGAVPGSVFMTRFAAMLAVVPALMLAGCDRTADPAAEKRDLAPTSSDPAPLPDAPQPGEPAATSAPAPAAPDLTPPKLVPEAERGETGARSLLLSFARAIELKEFGQAWSLLSPADRRALPRDRFAAQFADLGEITVAVPTGSMEGAAGSLIYTAPITITADDRDGRPIRYEGEVVLRRVNDVPGATPAQLRWHFQTLTLDWTH